LEGLGAIADSTCSKTPKTLTGIETWQKPIPELGTLCSKTPKTLTGIETLSAGATGSNLSVFQNPQNPYRD